MNLADLHKKLIATARSNPPSDRVPYAYSQRIMAHVKDPPRTAVDAWGFWAGGLWRGAVPCVVIMLALGAWSALTPERRAVTSDFSQQLENTVLATVDQEAVTTAPGE